MKDHWGLGYSIFYPYRGMDDQIFKNQCALERMIVWHLNPLEFILRQFEIPQKKMIPEKIFESAISKKVNSANLME